VLQIPLTPNHDRYVMTVRLDGRDYRLSFAYNGFSSAWYMSVATGVDKPLRSGMRLVDGGLYALSSAEEQHSPGLLLYMGPDAGPKEVLGTLSRLVYVSFDQLEQFGTTR
jgi:hypothetical protein